MKVKELIEELKRFDQEAPVVFTYNAGDYWHTMLAPEVDSADVGEIQFSDYHRRFMLKDGGEKVVVLKGL
jgi:hypothetical protein